MLKYLLAGVFSLFLVGSAFCEEKARTITVNGEGTSSATPDVLYINLAVVTERDSVSKAMSDNKEAMNKVFKTLKDAKIAEKDFCTNNFHVYPRHKYNNDEVKLVGYGVSNEVTVTVRDLDKGGDLLDALTKDGHANRINGISFDVLDKEKVLGEARDAAVANALKKANALAKVAGVKVDKVLTISEGSAYSPRAYSSMSRESARTPLAKGEQQFKASVNITLSLKD